MGLLHSHQSRLEQPEQELERQHEVERSLRRDIERRRELEEKLSRLKSNLRNKNFHRDREDTPLRVEDPFIEDIMRANVPINFKSPDMDLYDGTTDLKHHLSNFKSRMYLADVLDAIRCKVFPTTLTKAAMKWFDGLPPRRKLGPEWVQVVEEQIQALLKAGFIREVKYLTWLANMVLVKKQNGKWRMCDYTDLNKVCPKDPYPLPKIDTLVDSNSGYQYLSFIDAYSGYNQIPMYKPEQEKT
nr:uncharacterized protein LOC112803938 [Arachis hypogaea]